MLRKYLLICTLIIALFGIGRIARAQAVTPTPAPVSDDAVNAVSRVLYCPVCQNVTLEVCPTEACSRWRAQVRELLAEGKSEPEIRQYFIDKFGMRTVGVPTDTLGQVVALGVPFALIVIGGGVLTVRAIRHRSASAQRRAPEIGITDMTDMTADSNYAARLEAELRDRP